MVRFLSTLLPIREQLGRHLISPSRCQLVHSQRSLPVWPRRAQQAVVTASIGCTVEAKGQQAVRRARAMACRRQLDTLAMACLRFNFKLLQRALQARNEQLSLCPLCDVSYPSPFYLALLRFAFIAFPRHIESPLHFPTFSLGLLICCSSCIRCSVGLAWDDGNASNLNQSKYAASPACALTQRNR